MEITFIPAAAIVMMPDKPESGIAPVRIYRPYSSLPFQRIAEHAKKYEDLGAMQEIGERYYFGLGVPQSYESAYVWLLRAAEKNAPDAAYLIAECYRCGHFIEQDYQKYFQWLDRAAQQGSWLAMFALSAAYRAGTKEYGNFGPKIDHEQCYAWSVETEKTIRAYWDFYTQPNFFGFDEIKQRLLQAYADICNQLSGHFASGMGVNRDLKKSLEWLERGRAFEYNATGQSAQSVFDGPIQKMQERLAKEAARHAAQGGKGEKHDPE